MYSRIWSLSYENDYKDFIPWYTISLILTRHRYKHYAKDELAPEGLTEEDNTGGGYYDDAYIYTNWRLG